MDATETVHIVLTRSAGDWSVSKVFSSMGAAESFMYRESKKVENKWELYYVESFIVEHHAGVDCCE